MLKYQDALIHAIGLKDKEFWENKKKNELMAEQGS
jgi:hypothetical protein